MFQIQNFNLFNIVVRSSETLKTCYHGNGGLLSIENSFEKKNVEESYDWLSVEPPLRYTAYYFQF